MKNDRACHGEGCPHGRVIVPLLAPSFTVADRPAGFTRTETRRDMQRHLYADGPLGDPHTRRWFLCGDCHAARQARPTNQPSQE